MHRGYNARYTIQPQQYIGIYTSFEWKRAKTRHTCASAIIPPASFATLSITSIHSAAYNGGRSSVYKLETERESRRHRPPGVGVRSASDVYIYTVLKARARGGPRKWLEKKERERDGVRARGAASARPPLYGPAAPLPST